VRNEVLKRMTGSAKSNVCMIDTDKIFITLNDYVLFVFKIFVTTITNGNI